MPRASLRLEGILRKKQVSSLSLAPFLQLPPGEGEEPASKGRSAQQRHLPGKEEAAPLPRGLPAPSPASARLAPGRGAAPRAAPACACGRAGDRFQLLLGCGSRRRARSPAQQRPHQAGGRAGLGGSMKAALKVPARLQRAARSPPAEGRSGAGQRAGGSRSAPSGHGGGGCGSAASRPAPPPRVCASLSPPFPVCILPGRPPPPPPAIFGRERRRR